MRLGPVALIVTIVTSFILLLAYLDPAAAAWFTQESAGLPAPLQNNILATELFLGVTLGLLTGLAVRLPTAGRIRRTRQTLTRRHTLTAGHSTSSKPRIPPSSVHQASSSTGRTSSPKLGNWKPLPPMIKYFGGKSRLAPRIVERIPQHTTWVEPFAGGASVTLAKPPSQREVLADKRADLVRFYHAVKTGRPIKLPPHSKAEFARIRHKPESARTPGELVRLQGSSFGGHGQSFANSASNTTGRMLNKRMPLYAERLAHMKIINSDYRTIIDRYSSPRTAFYLDPPYPEDKQSYTHYGGRAIPTAEEVRSTVDHRPGKFIISYPDIPSVRKAFPAPKWHTEKLRVRNAYYSAGGAKFQSTKTKYRTELLITNYNPDRDHFKPETVLG